MKVLLVDDFDTTRKIIRNMLREINEEDVIEAKDGVVAKGILQNESVDLIIADWNMPNMTGLELLKEIRKSDTHKDVPFIMLTAEAEEQNIFVAIREKVSQYIIKPFTAETFYKKLEIVMAP